MTYSRDYVLIANFLMMMLLPLLLITVLNTKMYRKISKVSMRNSRITKRQRRDRKVAMLLMTVVIVFFFCNSIRVGLNTYEVWTYINVIFLKMITINTVQYLSIRLWGIIPTQGEGRKIGLGPEDSVYSLGNISFESLC